MSAGHDAIREALETLHQPGAIFEIRVLGAHGANAIGIGYFDNQDAATEAADRLDQSPDVRGVYVTLNQLNPACLARAANRCVRYAKASADTETVRRIWLLIDFDPVRPADVSATNEERHAALERMAAVRDELAVRGWPAPVEADSGNGAHLLYAIDLPNDDDAAKLVKACLGALDLMFSDDAVTIDKSVWNASRIVRLYGTTARKGDNVPDRPHRQSAIRCAPSEREVVSRDVLEALAATLPAEPKGYVSCKTFDLEAFMARHHIDVQRSGPWNGGRKFILRVCPFNDAHVGTSAAVMQLANGAIAFKCFHNGCAGRMWRDVRELFEPSGENPMAVAPRLDLVTLANVQPESVEWLWSQRIPKGKLTALVGDPEAGKSFLSLAIGSAVTRGAPLPDSNVPCAPKQVLIWNGEDGIEDTMRPRAECVVADLERLHVIRATVDERGKSKPFSIADAEALRERIIAFGDVGLVVIDPLAALLGRVDAWRDNDVRAALQPLVDIARETSVAILVVIHLRKAEAQRVLYRVGGSIGFVALARSVLLAAVDPENGRRAIVPVKANLSAKAPPVEYIVSAGPDGAPVFTWGTVASDLTAEHLLRPVKAQRMRQLHEAMKLLCEALPEDEWRPETEVADELEAAGISLSTYKRARSELGITSKRQGGIAGKGRWLLRTPKGIKIPTDDLVLLVDDLDGVMPI